MEFKDCYRIKGLARDASQDEGKRAYRQLAQPAYTRRQGGGHDDTVRHGRAQQPRPLPPGDGCRQPGAQAAHIKQTMRDKLNQPTRYIHEYGEDMPEIRNWQWPGTPPAGTGDR